MLQSYQSYIMSINKTLPNSVINGVKRINILLLLLFLSTMSLSNFCPSKGGKLYRLHDPFICVFLSAYSLLISSYTHSELCADAFYEAHHESWNIFNLIYLLSIVSLWTYFHQSKVLISSHSILIFYGIWCI